MSISESDYSLILALEPDPLISYSDLADKLQISWPTAKKRITKLEKQGILLKPFVSVFAEGIGLSKVNLILEVPNLNKMIQLENFFDFYPYTLYRARFIGKQFGLFLQLNIPEGAEDIIMELLDRLKDKQFVSKGEIFESTLIRYQIYPTIQKFNMNTGSWEFSWKTWLDRMPGDSDVELETVTEKPKLDEIKDVHLQILRILTEDASLKQSKIMKELNLSRTDTHRHYTYVMENFISEIRLNYKREIFNISDSYLVIIRDLAKKDLINLFSHFKDKAPPFRISFEIINNHTVLIWGTMSNTQALDFAFALWEKYPQMEYYPLSNRDDSVRRHSFKPENFDLEKKKWKDNRQYLLEIPLSTLVSSE
ncbi:MAG: winged helix-turn-helix domain-containing protein [Candidatus Heimdallarchaeota archaeon]|nr:winged helix-turn-helix domain-containing protein [Candidatus Heimdallarchaeota archaeon]